MAAAPQSPPQEDIDVLMELHAVNDGASHQ